MFDEIREELSEVIGANHVLHGPDIATFLTDLQGFYSGEALAVVRPASTSQVAETVKICARHRVTIVPQGGHTGLCGGAVPSSEKPAIILSLARMNKILDVDPQCYSVTVEAGVILQSIHDAAADVDRAFAMDWGARGSAMVGGGIATNAGGGRAAGGAGSGAGGASGRCRSGSGQAGSAVSGASCQPASRFT